MVRRLAPRSPGWNDLGDFPVFGFVARRWYHSALGLVVISAVEVARDKDGIDRGPEYHLSVSKAANGRPCRCSSAEAEWMLREFGLEGAEEDNHVPNGLVRNFWRTVAEPLIGLECACKAEETAVVEDNGEYVWRV